MEQSLNCEQSNKEHIYTKTIGKRTEPPLRPPTKNALKKKKKTKLFAKEVTTKEYMRELQLPSAAFRGGNYFCVAFLLSFES